MTDSRYLPALRAAFLVAVLVFAWLGLRGRIDEIGSALRATSSLGVALALLSVLAGLLATSLLWLRLMTALGADLPFREGLATFFVGGPARKVHPGLGLVDRRPGTHGWSTLGARPGSPSPRGCSSSGTT